MDDCIPRLRLYFILVRIFEAMRKGRDEARGRMKNRLYNAMSVFPLKAANKYVQHARGESNNR